ncbi:MAG: hypothetical protein FWF91_01840 [Coriobacteriia bacterium]|nr:hypothetical protein [Coriobacteriia bacterium]
MSTSFARMGTYLGFLIRRERIVSVIWIVSVVGLVMLFTSLYPSLTPDEATRLQLATTMSSPAMVAMMGNVYGMEQLSQASIMAQECLIWYLVAVVIMNIFLINRHTRVDEELGRLELFRALPVGRLTGSLAIIVLAFLVNLIIALLSAAGLILLDIGGVTTSGALAFGLAIGAGGFVFAGLTMLCAQVFSTSRSVSGAGFVLLGLFYIMRALGDVSDNALSLISPLGLALKVEAFYSDAVLPLVILLIEGLVLAAAALAICAVRDHGAGVVPARRGRAHATRFLRSPLGLAWRLSRGTSLAWGIGLFVLGASYGSVCADVDSFIEGNELMQQVVGAAGTGLILDNYVALIFAIMSMVTSVPVVLSVLRIHNEEKRGRLEQIFAKSVPRLSLYRGFLLVALIESLAFQVLLALGLSAASGGELAMGAVIGAALCYLPAIWAIAGLAILLVGYLPKLTALVWAVFAYTFVAMYFGRIMDVPEWVQRITPFGNIPQLPIQDFTLLPLVLLTLIAIVLAVPGAWRFTQRDIG